MKYYILTNNDSNKVVTMTTEAITAGEEQTVYERELEELPIKEEKELNDSFLCYDSLKFYTEFTPSKGKRDSAIYQAHKDCDKAIESFEYQGHKVDLHSRNQQEYKDGVLLVLLLGGDMDGILPMQMRFADGDYTFTTMDEVKDFYLQSAIHMRQCYADRRARLDEIDELTNEE